MQITAIVPNWNGGERLLRVLADAASQTLKPERLLVIDNASTDRSDSRAEANGAEVIRLETNTGFAHAVNAGIRAAVTPGIAVLNNDIELAPDYLERLAAAIDSGAAFATGKILSKRTGHMIDGSFDLTCLGRTPWRCGAERQDSAVWNRPRAIHSPPWTAALFRRDLFDRIGLLDERFESYLEDVDFGIRCGLAGVEGKYEPKAVAWHWGSATLGAWHPGTVRRIARNQVWLARKYPPRRWLSRTGWDTVLAQSLWAGVVLRRGQFFPWLRGKWQGLTANIPVESRDGDAVLKQDEALLETLQRATGPDLYWRLYFALH